MTLSRKVLRKIDDSLRAEFDQEQGEWMAKVPISGATKVVWQRYCQAVGVGMGEGVALLMLHELASIAGEDAQRLADRFHIQEAEMKVRAQELTDREKNLRQRERSLSLRMADLENRTKELAARERNVAAVEHSLSQNLRPSTRGGAPRRSTPKLGRNDPCWCGSGKKYKTCHLDSDQSR
jgi:hypothetical protein